MSCKIAEVEAKKQGSLITLDSGEQIWLSRHLLYEYGQPIEPNAEIDPDALKEWLLPRQYQAALHYAVELLARQPRSGGEIRKKLEARKYIAETIEMVIYKLETLRFLDDRAYAENYAQAKARAHMGKSRIRMDLKRKGLDAETIEEALSTIDADEAESAAVRYAKQVLKRYQKEPDVYKRKQKALAAMARRGYDYESSREALSAAAKELQNE